MVKIRVIDELNPEDVAMLQALYSRSAKSVDEHIERVKRTSSGKFMQSYYVGYGHKSIADCGSTTIFIEGVSLLAAKAIQNHALYSGQETSTRYIDMAAQPLIDPIDTKDSKAILDRWMSFYTESQEPTRAHVRRTFPRRDGEDSDTYERAVNARTFDILRGFLPAGITTQLSWHTNLRQAADHLARLESHPLVEVRGLAMDIQHALGERYPSSGFRDYMAGVSGMIGSAEGATARREWEDKYSEQIAYPNEESWMDSHIQMLYADDDRTAMSYGEFGRLLAERPRGSVLPQFLTDLGSFKLQFPLDFGSFRDLQRHRNGALRMPVLTPARFEPWYLAQLDPTTRDRAETLIAQQQRAIEKLKPSGVYVQYYVALGFQVVAHITMGLPALVYLFELRSSKTVHPTLRAKILSAIDIFTKRYPSIALHVDRDPDDWTVRRGEQTITEKP